jgi:hypothetical protein
MSLNLTLPQSEKFKVMVENTVFDNEESFKSKIKMIKENLLEKGIKNNETLTETVVENSNTEIADPLMKIFAETIKQTHNR